jgi:hypothetical protein
MTISIIHDDLILDSIVERLVKSDVAGTVVSKRYKNIIDWIVRGLGVTTLYEYKRQFQVLADFFGLLCEECNSKLLNKVGSDLWRCSIEELKGLVLREIDYENEVLVCKKCGSVVERMPYRDLVLAVGMRSGKTTTASFMATWVCYMSLLYPRLDKRFNLIPGQRLRYSMVATAERQGEKTVWSNFKALLLNAVDSEVRDIFLSRKKLNKNGVVIDSEKETEWNVGLVDFINLPSNSGSLAGGTGVGMILEEYSRFIVSESFRSAQEVYAVLDRSMKTLRGLAKSYIDDMFTLEIIIGSPYYVINDPIMEAVYGIGYKDSDIEWGEYEDFEKKRLAYHYPTWLFNPKLTENDFSKEKNENYDLFMRDFGAIPIKAMSRYFDNEMVEKSIIEGEPLIKFVSDVKLIGGIKFITADVVDIKADFVKYSYTVHVDLGEVDNLLSMVFARLDDEGRIAVDGMLVLKPDKESGMRAYIDTPVAILDKLKRFLNVSMITFDRWQSSSGINKLLELGYKVGRRSVGRNEFELFRNLINSGEVKIIVKRDSYEAKVLLDEFRELRILQNGKLSHVDLLCSVVGAALNQRDLFGAKLLNSKSGIKPVVNESFKNMIPTSFRGRW